jgi:hypothetical protein
MTCIYATTELNKWGHRENKFDMARFAADLAVAIGGKVEARPPDRFSCDGDIIEVDGVRIRLAVSTWRAAFDRVHVTACHPVFEGKYHDHPYGTDYKMPGAYVSAGRPLAALASDIRRRVVEPARAPIARWIEHRKIVADRGSDLVARAARLREWGLDVRLNEGETRSGSVWHGKPYFSGEFYADGTVSLRNVTFTAVEFERMVEAVCNNGGSNG